MSAANRVVPVIGPLVIGSVLDGRGPVDTSGLISTAPGALRAWPWLPELVREGRVYVGPTGETLIARVDGGLDEVRQGSSPWGRSIASDPAPGIREG